MNLMSKVTVSKIHTLTGHRDCIYTLRTAKEENLFFSGAGDGMVVEWDLKNPDNGQLIAKVPNSVYALAYDLEEGILIVGHNYNGLHFIDVASRKETGLVSLTKSAIYDIQWFQDHIYVGTGDGELIVVDRFKRKVISNIKISVESVRSIAINQEVKHMAVGCSDNKIRIIDLSTHKVLQEKDSHSKSVFTVNYSPDDQYLFSGSRDAHLKIWSVKNNYQLQESIVAHMYAINHVDFSPDRKHFVTCSMDKSIKVWDAVQFQLLKVIDKSRHDGHGASVNKLLWSNYDNQLISCSDDRTISIWDLKFDN